MKRLHLVELEDLEWFPASIRNYGTDYLRTIVNKLNAYKPILPLLKTLLAEQKETTIIDLCAGAGGGWEVLQPKLLKENPKLKIYLSDYYPNKQYISQLKNHNPNSLHYIESSIDARNVPQEMKGIRTMFLSFHHFNPEDAVKILANTVESKQAIAIFELQERSFMSVFAILFSPLNVLILTPFIKPFRLKRLFFTYLIPVIPLFVLWDGVVSCFRTYSPSEMRDLIQKADKNNLFTWETRKIKNGIAPILYTIDCPTLK